MEHFQELNHDLINDRVYIAHSIALILPNSVKAPQKILCQVHLNKQTRKFFFSQVHLNKQTLAAVSAAL